MCRPIIVAFTREVVGYSETRLLQELQDICFKSRNKESVRFMPWPENADDDAVSLSRGVERCTLQIWKSWQLELNVRPTERWEAGKRR